jgi:hypothetical protein
MEPLPQASFEKGVMPDQGDTGTGPRWFSGEKVTEGRRPRNRLVEYRNLELSLRNGGRDHDWPIDPDPFRIARMPMLWPHAAHAEMGLVPIVEPEVSWTGS